MQREWLECSECSLRWGPEDGESECPECGSRKVEWRYGAGHLVTVLCRHCPTRWEMAFPASIDIDFWGVSQGTEYVTRKCCVNCGEETEIRCRNAGTHLVLTTS